MTTPEPITTSIKIKATAKVACPVCGKPHYDGPLVEYPYQEPVKVGDKFTCSQCGREVVIREEKLEMKPPKGSVPRG